VIIPLGCRKQWQFNTLEDARRNHLRNVDHLIFTCELAHRVPNSEEEKWAIAKLREGVYYR
jgi:hypothetical protein